jgi:hypothetical protein
MTLTNDPNALAASLELRSTIASHRLAIFQSQAAVHRRLQREQYRFQRG